MKRIITALLAIAITTGAVAQKENKMDKMHNGRHKTDHHKGMKKHGMMKGKMAEKLNLTDAQKQKMKTINEKFRNDMKELNAKENITVKEQRDRREKLAKQHRADMNNVLTPEQKKQKEEMRSEMESKRKDMGAKKMQKMQEKLNLSDNQVQKIKANNDAFHAKMKALKENENLSREKKKAEMESLKENHKREMKTILTPEQQEKMKNMGDRKGKGNRQRK